MIVLLFGPAVNLRLESCDIYIDGRRRIVTDGPAVVRWRDRCLIIFRHGFSYIWVCVTSSVGETWDCDVTFQRQQQTANRKRIEIKHLPDKWKAMFCVWWIESAKEHRREWENCCSLISLNPINQARFSPMTAIMGMNERKQIDSFDLLLFVPHIHEREGRVYYYEQIGKLRDERSSHAYTQSTIIVFSYGFFFTLTISRFLILNETHVYIREHMVKVIM